MTVENSYNLKQTLKDRLRKCIEIIDYVKSIPNDDLYIVAKVKSDVSESDLIKAGQSKDLEYITYIVQDDHTSVEWICKNKSYSASGTEMLSHDFEFKRRICKEVLLEEAFMC